MYPKIGDINLGIFTLPVNTYGFMIMIGFIFTAIWSVRRGKLIGLDADLILDVAITSMLVGIAAAKLNYIILHSIEYKDKWDIFYITDGGLSIAGGIIGALIPPVFYFIYAIWKAKPIRVVSWGFFWMCTLVVIFAIVGSRIYYLREHGKEYDMSILRTWNSGFVLYGGVICAIVTEVIILKIRKQNVMKFADLAAPFIMLALAFGRLGCFLNGCCWGKLCNLPWAIKFPSGSNAWYEHLQRGLIKEGDKWSLSVHPTQIYESIATFIIFLILSYFWKRKVTRKEGGDGKIFAMLGILYPLFRFFSENLRADNLDSERVLWGLTYSQIVSIGVFVISLVAFIVITVRAKITSKNA